MMSSPPKRPWCIEWSAALFIAIAAFSTLVHAGSKSRHEALADWPKYLVEWAICGGIALAVASGWRPIRVIFACIAIFSLPQFFDRWDWFPWNALIAWSFSTFAFMVLLETRHIGIGISIFFSSVIVSFIAGAFRPLTKIRKSTPPEWDFGLEVMILFAAALCFLPAASLYFNRRGTPSPPHGPSQP